jgi:hypothetical protein
MNERAAPAGAAKSAGKSGRESGAIEADEKQAKKMHFAFRAIEGVSVGGSSMSRCTHDKVASKVPYTTPTLLEALLLFWYTGLWLLGRVEAEVSVSHGPQRCFLH